MVAWVGLQCLFDLFPDHTHLLLDTLSSPAIIVHRERASRFTLNVMWLSVFCVTSSRCRGSISSLSQWVGGGLNAFY